jgi:type VI secretion system FHA domain protein
MILTLEVASPYEGTPGAALRRVFDSTGGTIGRLPDNDWVLPDGYVSSHHARIRYTGGVFEIEDTSTNGVFINSPSHRLERGQPYALKSGDRILIDPYEIVVSISQGPSRAAPVLDDDPFGLPEPPPHPAARPYPVSSLQPEPVGGADVDPMSLLGLDSDRAPAPAAPRAADLARGSLLSEHYQAPHVSSPSPAASPSLIPDDYDPLNPSSGPIAQQAPPRPVAPPPPAAPVPPAQSFATQAMPPAPPMSEPRVAPRPPAARAPVEPPARRDQPSVDLAAVLAAAGITDVTVTPELAENFGRILRVVVAGVIDVLQARQRIKSEFRVPVTGFMPAQNNPLKFSANVDDALHNLLVRRNPAFLGPVDAFEDAFDDVRNHQMAMLAGVRVAFEAMLKEFDPEHLQQAFDRHGKGSLLAVPARLRYWDLYRDKFSDMVSDADACFRELFGNEFAKAYEDQLERLKAHDRSRRR